MNLSRTCAMDLGPVIPVPSLLYAVLRELTSLFSQSTGFCSMYIASKPCPDFSRASAIAAEGHTFDAFVSCSPHDEAIDSEQIDARAKKVQWTEAVGRSPLIPDPLRLLLISSRDRSRFTAPIGARRSHRATTPGYERK